MSKKTIKCCHSFEELLYENIAAFEQDLMRFANSHISLKYKKASGIISVEYLTVDNKGNTTFTYKPESPVDFELMNIHAILPI
jgi:hypothetical protein